MPEIKINPIYKPFATRPSAHKLGLAYILRSQISISTWMIMGASLQALAFLLFSRAYYLGLLGVCVLGYKLADLWLVTYGWKSNPYMKGVIPGRVTALLPEGESGEIKKPASGKVVILHLGAKSNHPLGFLAPQMRKVGEWIAKMNKEIETVTPGFMGQSYWTREAENGVTELVYISYWDSVESLWAFAHSGVHRESWVWWEKNIKDNGAVALNHEIFEADANKWENVYMNFQPTLMGATTFLKKNGKLEGGQVAEEWVSGLVDARRGPLAKSSVRFGKQEDTTHDISRVAKETYA